MKRLLCLSGWAAAQRKWNHEMSSMVDALFSKTVVTKFKIEGVNIREEQKPLKLIMPEDGREKLV